MGIKYYNLSKMLIVAVLWPSCVWLCNLMHCIIPGFLVLHNLSICSNSSPLSHWFYPTISYSVALFFTYPQYFPASWSFPVSWFFISVGQSIGDWASVLPMNIQYCFPLDWQVWSPCTLRDWRIFSSTTVWKHQFFCAYLSLWPNSHIHTWLLEKL